MTKTTNQKTAKEDNYTMWAEFPRFFDRPDIGKGGGFKDEPEPNPDQIEWLRALAFNRQPAF